MGVARALRKKSQAVSSGLRACGSHGSNGEAPAREEALLLGVIVPSPGGGDRSGAAGGEEDMRALLQTKGLLVHDSMAAKKEALVCVLDVSSHMNTGDPTHFSTAVRALVMLVQQKLLVKPKDEMTLILVGTEGTDNPTATELGGYEHITVARGMGPADVALLRTLQDLKPSTTGAGDLFDALVVALSLLTPYVKHDKRIFFLTNCEASMDEDGQAEGIGDQLAALGVKLDIIGPDLDDLAASAGKAATVALFDSLAKKVNGHILSAHQALEAMSALRARSVTPTTKFRGVLDIGNVVSIPIWTYGKTVEVKMPTMKKLSTVAPADADNSGAVGLDRQYRSAEDLSKEIPAEDRVRSFRYGKELFPIPADAEALMKYETERCFHILCFVNAAKLPRHYFMSGVDVIVPEPNSLPGSMGVAALAHGLHKTKRVAIARYVKRKNAAPTFAVVTPCIVSSPIEAAVLGEDSAAFVCLFVNEIPFAEDLRCYTFPSFTASKHAPSAAQLAAAGDLIASMDLMHADVDSEGRRSEALKPEVTFNPTLQMFNQWLSLRAMTPGAPMPPPDDVIKKALDPPAELLASAAPAMASFKKAFKLTPNEKARAKKRRYWGEGIDADGPAADTAAAAAAGASTARPVLADVDAATSKRKPGLGPADINVGDLFGGDKVSAVGSVDPIGNFNAMLARRDVDLMDKAINGMQKQIDRLVSEGTPFFSKAIECMAALRKGCVENYEEDAYNDYLNKIKTTHAPGQFWEELKSSSASVGLITSEESASVRVTRADADAFWSSGVTIAAVAPAPPASLPPPADDLFADMD